MLHKLQRGDSEGSIQLERIPGRQVDLLRVPGCRTNPSAHGCVIANVGRE